MLPPRIQKKAKATGRWKSPAHLNFVRSHQCCVPGCNRRPIEVAHLRIGTDAGMGRKASDYFTISLCGDLGHHAEQHRIGEQSFARLHGIDMHALAEAFAAASPKAGEIRLAKQERKRAND